MARGTRCCSAFWPETDAAGLVDRSVSVDSTIARTHHILSSFKLNADHYRVQTPDVDPHTISAYLETSIGLLSTHGLTVDELLAVREMLEVPAARLAATERTDSELEALRIAVEHENSEAGPQHEHPQSFHILLLTCAHNGLLEVVTRPIFSVLKNRFLREGAPVTFWDQVCADHADMVEAIERHDAAAAGDLMQQHLHRLRETYLEIDRRRAPS